MLRVVRVVGTAQLLRQLAPDSSSVSTSCWPPVDCLFPPFHTWDRYPLQKASLTGGRCGNLANATCVASEMGAPMDVTMNKAACPKVATELAI